MVRLMCGSLALKLLVGVRRLWVSVVWGSLILLCCRSLRIRGLRNLPETPVIIAANHASHADTVLLQFVLATRHRRPVLVAGAEDYWFRSALMKLGAVGLGVFAFPRNGKVGVFRARKAIRKEASVVLFPQGSRAGGRFRQGVGHIAEDGSTDVVPVYIDGSSRILARGQRWPRRAHVAIVFGAPMRREASESAGAFADRLGEVVLSELASTA
ncbi:MAG: lysophospholipid acyltransferase family protein [Acidimicrobiia bacterium]